MIRTISAMPFLAISFAVCTSAWTQEPERVQGPADSAIVRGRLGGQYFAPKPLTEEYQRLLDKVGALQVQIGQGRISAADAAAEIDQLRSDLETVRAKLETDTTFVAAAKIHNRSEETTFELGPEQSLLIVADRARILGWDGPGVKCVLDKTVLSTDDEPVDEHFAAIRVAHRHGAASDLVGRSLQEIAEDETEFLASSDGQKLTPEQLANRKQFIDQIYASSAQFRMLQGKPIDVVEIEGLRPDGNKQLSLGVESPGGESSQWSTWQRHASLTIYVPPCRTVGLIGGRAGLDVQSLTADLTIRGDGDRDYDGEFTIRDLTGSLVARQIPLQAIDGISGDVFLEMAVWLGNSGTRHADDARTSYVETPQRYVYRRIQGGLSGTFIKADLELAEIGGRLDVRNEFGDTLWAIDRPPVEAAHRIISDGGHIEVRLAKGVLDKLPARALTECGTVRVEDLDATLESVSFEGGLEGENLRRGLMGFMTPAEGEMRFFHMERAWQAWKGEDRTPGLDLISRGGSIHLVPVGGE